MSKPQVARTISVSTRTINLAKVASGLRGINVCVLLNFAVIAAMLALVFLIPHPPAGQQASTVQNILLAGVLALFVGWFGVGIAGLVYLCRLCSGLGSSQLLVVLFMLIGFLIPLVGLITLAIASSRASFVLKMNGIKVGLMGVPSSERHKLFAEPCPVCGRGKEDPAARTCIDCVSATDPIAA